MANKKPKTTTKSSTVDIKVGRYHKTTHRTKVTTTKIGPKVQLTKAQRTWIAIGLIALPVVVGFIASALTRDIMESFGALNQPPFAPPAWLFPVAWTLLYILMGVASFLIWRQDPRTKEGKKLRRAELIIYFVQLALNFCWTLLFFRFGLRYFAFAWLLVMWALILTLIIMTSKNSKAAMWCLIPYLLWCTFAAVLNISIAILN
ncbi:tryptophan-rich sensory protein [Candidatus Saccharibacteria bacterium]|nr:tryptophan-rich sensory protein [Candidatus Saccharibacteria bacterium]